MNKFPTPPKSRYRIHLSPPYLSGNEFENISCALNGGYIAPLGEWVEYFENEISKIASSLRDKPLNVLATSSGTAAIHLAIRALDLKDGDIVLASSLTFIGSVAPLLYERCEIVLLDCDESWHTSPDIITQAINELRKDGKKAKALIITHLYGQMADIEKIADICNKEQILLIEDAAEALGACINGKNAGSFGVAGIYSFNGNKIITTSGGGAILSNDLKLIQKAEFLSTQAKEIADFYEHKTYGYNYRLSNILAAVGVAQIATLNSRIKRKREIFSIYKNELSGFIEFMPEIHGCIGTRWLSSGILDNKGHVKILIEALKNNSIESRRVWKPMHLQPLFCGVKFIGNGISNDIFDRGICLPSGIKMSDDEVKHICDIIKKALS